MNFCSCSLNLNIYSVLNFSFGSTTTQSRRQKEMTRAISEALFNDFNEEKKSYLYIELPLKCCLVVSPPKVSTYQITLRHFHTAMEFI